MAKKPAGKPVPKSPAKGPAKVPPKPPTKPMTDQPEQTGPEPPAKVPGFQIGKNQ
jgi:hypothetical protein